ncbi:MAG TPA: bifunctional 5,10-methylenetetrahydrofolate dehydrogenase/5,10-methenyltetrahydrofolate cyclohydrolase [Candidatus Acidoferrales bacterium]|jgi:methylenetetrahydrofolate dehydrogenase (NADP+) / methenyltetrahydrofolate cyclohydrolase|nr:bifunctional 5,10-methylenetetrahydrofolate dehydrogenase/5,10-methenyltetrahydrofolate cyclohydrolase [Candidatus Acidoferrales bacterium]
MTVSAGARLLEGAPFAAEIRERVTRDAAAYTAAHGHPAGLAVVVCGRDAPSMVYLERILKACAAAGIAGRVVDVPIEPGDPIEGREAALADAVRTLSGDPTVAGIIVQQPLPAGIRLRSIIDAIDPAKDIDGIHPLNAGLLRLGYEGFVPATAHAAMEMVHRAGVPIAGADAVVIGRSAVVGMPVAFMLTKENATVTVCHRQTRDLGAKLREADIVVVAAGRPGLVTGSMLKPGAVVIDVGINVVDGRITGDVDFASAREVASAITPVPGGVGPLTNALLLSHLMRAAERQAETAEGNPR